MSKGWIVVTGASRGIGAAIAEDLVGRGFEVAALSRSGAAPFGTSYACDVCDEKAVEDVMADVAGRGPLIGVVNNAGQQKSIRIVEMSTSDYEAIMRLDATAVLTTSRIAYPHLCQAGGGTIVNIGSFFDKLGVRNNLAYCAAKAAVGAMTRCMAVEWARDGIAVIDVAPGYVETDLNRSAFAEPKFKASIEKAIPVGRPAQSNEIARFVGALFAEKIPFLTGETIYVDGAHGIASR